MLFSSLIRAMTPKRGRTMKDIKKKKTNETVNIEEEDHPNDQKPTAVTTTITTTTAGSHDDDDILESSLSIPDLWKILDRELRVNIGTSVKCGICLSTVLQPMRTPCVHSFCRDCILASLHNSRKCPECQSTISKRSLQPFDYLEHLASNYKTQLLEFGFCPSTYTETFTTLTQKVVEENTTNENTDGIVKCITPQRSLDRLHVATTWQQQALPVAAPPALQIQENQLVVQANQKACRGLLQQVQLQPLLPNTQEVQDLAREQQAADWQAADQPTTTQEEDEDSTVVPSQAFCTPAEFGTEELPLQEVDEEEEEDVDTKPAAATTTTPIRMEPNHVVMAAASSKSTDAVTPPTAATDTAAPFEAPLLSPIDYCESSQPPEPTTTLLETTTTPPQPILNDEDDNVQPSPTTNNNKNNVTDGMVEDSFGALHWTNAIAPTQEQETTTNIHNDDDNDDGGEPTMTQGDWLTVMRPDAESSPKDDGSSSSSLVVTEEHVTNDDDPEDAGAAAPEETVFPNNDEDEDKTQEMKDEDVSPLLLKQLKKNDDDAKKLNKDDDDAKKLKKNEDDAKKSKAPAAKKAIKRRGGRRKKLARKLSMSETSEEKSFRMSKEAASVLAAAAPASDASNNDRKSSKGRKTYAGSYKKRSSLKPADAPPLDSPKVGDLQSKNNNHEDEEDNAAPPPVPQEEPKRVRKNRSSAAIKAQATVLAKTTTASSTLQAVSASSESADNTNSNQTSDGTAAITATFTPSSSSSSCAWAVGTIVTVESRTWPGVNKPGGVARISRVNEKDGTYNVAYVLGGKESGVDAVFLSPSTSNDDDTSRKRRPRQQDELPKALLQALAAQGFDTTGTAGIPVFKDKKMESTEQPSKAATKKGPSPKVLQDSTNRKRSKSNDTSSNKRSKSSSAKITKEARAATATTTAKTASRKRKSAEKDAVQQEGAKPAPAKCKNRSSASSTTSRKSEASIEILPTFSNEEACRLSDERYRERFQAALDEKVVHVVASNLTDSDLNILRALCSKTLAQDVKLKLSETFGKKTTVCIMPADDPDAHGNLTPRNRTLKAMRSALAGVPIVSPAWIHACGAKNEAVLPTTNFIARSLPTKTDAIDKSGEARFGLAKLAALLSHSKKATLPLHSTSVFLCGAFSQSKRHDLQVLSKEAGAKVLTSPSAVAAKLLSSSNTTNTKVVLLCHDAATGVVIPSVLEKEVTKFREQDTRDQVDAMVVNPNWLFDSIACARALPADAFPPTNPKANDLWQLCVTAAGKG